MVCIVYHHIIDGINPGIGSQIINQKNSRLNILQINMTRGNIALQK